MSRASKLTLLGTSLFAAGTIVLVHFQQKWEQEAMHAGVIRDLEQQRLKMAQRQAEFDAQRALEAEYKKEQSVRDTTNDAPLVASGKSSSSGEGWSLWKK